MKRFFATAAAGLLAAAVFFPVDVSAVSARKGCVMDGTTGAVVWEKGAFDQSLIASTTKIMTALIICEQCNVLDRMQIPAEAVGIEGSSMYLREGEVLTLQELLYGLMLSSGNDAATALAIYCGGTVEGFTQQMNDKARALGLTGTHFANPHGLDAPDHYSTARDLAVLGAYAMKNPIFRKTVSTKSLRIGERYLTNHNKLLWQVDGADGIKTGYTRSAGRILVSSALRQDRRLVCVTIDDPDDWKDHTRLLEEGFSRYQREGLLACGDLVGTLEVEGGQGSKVEILAAQDFSFAVAQEERPQIVLPGAGFVYAPVAEGGNAGFAYVVIDGCAVGKVPVVYGKTVEKVLPEERTLFEKLFGGDRHG